MNLTFEDAPGRAVVGVKRCTGGGGTSVAGSEALLHMRNTVCVVGLGGSAPDLWLLIDPDVSESLALAVESRS